jgi:hypothetical protein
MTIVLPVIPRKATLLYIAADVKSARSIGQLAVLGVEILEPLADDAIALAGGLLQPLAVLVCNI